MCGLSVLVSGGYSLLWCAAFSLWRLLLLRNMGSRRMGFSSCGSRLSSCGSRALEHRLSSCGARAQLLHDMWDPPRPGLEPVSSALAGGFPTTGPPGKPWWLYFKEDFIQELGFTVIITVNTFNPWCSEYFLFCTLCAHLVLFFYS